MADGKNKAGFSHCKGVLQCALTITYKHYHSFIFPHVFGSFPFGSTLLDSMMSVSDSQLYSFFIFAHFDGNLPFASILFGSFLIITPGSYSSIVERKVKPPVDPPTT
jgi:hypothetical protein